MLFQVHQVQMGWSNSFRRLAMAATATLLPASCAACLCSCLVTYYHPFLILSPGECSLFGRCSRRGTPLACLDLPDQVVYHPSRTAVSLLATQAYQLRHFR